MTIKIIHQHNLIPDEIHLPYPAEFLKAIEYNSQIWCLYNNLQTHELKLSNGLDSILIDPNICSYYKHSINVIPYSDNILWIGLYNSELLIKPDKTTSCFYIVDLLSLKSNCYSTDFNIKLIKPIGQNYWYYQPDESSNVAIYNWTSLTQLDSSIQPILDDKPGVKYYPVSWSGASFVRVEDTTLDFLDSELNCLFSGSVFSFFPGYKPLECPYPNSEYAHLIEDSEELNSQFKWLITINDNCLLYYEWYDVIDGFVDIEGSENKLCFNFNNDLIIKFKNNVVRYYVSNVFPFINSDGIINLSSSECYPAGSWTAIYEPIEPIVVKENTNSLLGKRKANYELNICP